LTVFVVLAVAYTAVVANFDQPFVSFAFAGAVVFLFVAKARTREWIAGALAALIFGLCHAHFLQGKGGAPSMSLCAGMFGRGALVVLGAMTIWASPSERSRRLRMFLLPVGILLFVLASLVALNLTVPARPRLLDAYLYAFDGSLGFQPSFLMGRLFSDYPLLAGVGREGYLALPVAIALVCAGYLEHTSWWRPLAVLATAGALGYLLYWVFPAAGPVYFAGTDFPRSPQSFSALAINLHPVTLPLRAPRNAMPSLHMAWALLLWFNCRPFSRTAGALALAYIVLTVLATLGTGEHYLIDLVVAAPFAVAVQAMWSRESPAGASYAALACGVLLTLFWLITLRYSPESFQLSAAVPWLCLVVTIGISLWLERYLKVP